MVSAAIIELSNNLIKSVLPAGLIAVFVGATNGVGETTVKQFARYANQPRVYLIGRSEEAGNRIVGECEALNSEGTFIFLKRETSLMRNVDELCKEITSKEKVINLLFLSVGTLQISSKTPEGLNYPMALTLHARSRIISNLLPHILHAPSLRRVITVYGATFESRISMTDFQGWNLGRMANMGHTASLITLDLEAHQQLAPEVSFVHNFPGAVESGIARGEIGPLMRFLKTVYAVLGSLVHIPLVEAGDRHVFFATSARFSAKGNGEGEGSEGVPLVEGLERAMGTDGVVASGVYSINESGESAGAKVLGLLAGFREEGVVKKVREGIESDINGALAAGVEK